MIDFPLCTTPSAGKKTARNAYLNFMSSDELLPEKNYTLDLICKGILDGSTFISEYNK